MNRFHSRRISLVRVARTFLAALLLTAFSAGVVPLVPVSAGSTCQLECCAGRAPHASGSCMHGSCQANLSAPAHGHHATEPVDEFCGLPKKIETKSFPRSRIKSTAHLSSDHIASLAFEKTCQPDCGGCALGSTNTNRQRNSSAIASSDRPRPPTNLRLANLAYSPVQTFRAQRRQGAPRGPPLVHFLT
jgi:hypothetical protein